MSTARIQQIIDSMVESLDDSKQFNHVSQFTGDIKAFSTGSSARHPSAHVMCLSSRWETVDNAHERQSPSFTVFVSIRDLHNGGKKDTGTEELIESVIAAIAKTRPFVDMEVLRPAQREMAMTESGLHIIAINFATSFDTEYGNTGG